ncbi:MAG: PDZ domain-containing protein, partial [Fimbriimonadaceae bacterium]|nr:PDZ domain-containing protein [Fimbriimonadaceae bacterium]
TAIEFEVPDSRFAGALLFSMRGELVGSIAATLRSESVSNQVQRSALGNAAPRGFGPAPIAVGYAVSPAVVERVVDGFRSPTHRVRHPKIGVFCKDHPQGGALVQSVEPGSPGALAGIKPGDIIAEIDGTAIRNQLDVAAVVFDTEVGQIIRVTYRRGQTQTIASIRVGT